MTAISLWLSRRPQRRRALLTLGSFVLPVLLWCLVSYVPFIWHPKVMIEVAGGVDYFTPGMLVDRDEFADQAGQMKAQGLALPSGRPANPIYLPAPHQVAQAFYSGFTTAPESRDGVWLHQSLWHSIQIIFWGVFSVLILTR